MERICALLMLMLFTLPTQAAVQMHYMHNDHLGTPRVVTNQARQVVWKGQLKPFGETRVEVETISNHRRFPGQRFDIESRLYYNYFRDYDPTTGRYMQSDPIGLGGGLNTYGYAYQNALNYIDPFGLEVVVNSRGVKGTGGAGSHTFTTVTQANGTITNISSHSKNGDNVISLNHPSDTGANVTDSVVIAIPSGMTEAQFDQAVLDRANKLISELPVAYRLFPDIYKDFPNSPSEGNCHTTTTNLINGAGSRIPKTFNPRGLNPGLN